MKNLLTPWRTSALLLLMMGWGWAHAQSLGTPAAEVLMGQPLQLTLPARFEGETADAEPCVHADVFFGETRLGDAAVRASVTGPADNRRIHIETSRPVDEPIVTVSVRAGCRNSITRNYTLLPEYPSEQRLAAMDARNAMANATPVAPLKLARAAAPASPIRKTGPRLPAARGTVADATPVRTRGSSTHPPRREAAARGPRLKLEPLDLSEQQPLLHASAALADPHGDPARRATAALLWQAINADPEEVMRTSVMIRQLEQDLAALRQSSGQTHAEVLALRERMDRAQPWYLSPVFVQMLGLLVLATAAAAAFLWWRTRDLRGMPPAWYLPPEEAELPVRAAPVAPPPAVAAPVAPTPVEPAPAAAGPIDFEVPELAAAAATPRTGHGDGVLRVEALAATFEETEFLTSLGLLHDAMDILKNYLQDSGNPAPVAYLELMRLCEEAEDPAAVATVRRRYARVFGVEAPRLAQFTADGGLDSLPDLSARVTRAWGRGEVLQVLERALFAVSTPAAPVTLQAARDLLALYDLALTRATDGAVAADDAPLAPWAHADDAQSAQSAAQDAADAEGGRQFALDVDLSAPEVPAPAPTLELVPQPAQPQPDPERERKEAARRQQEQADAFSAAVASERMPVSRY